MPTEPSTKRVVAFLDGQNLFYAVKKAFGYSHPNFDPLRLARAICEQQNWQLTATHFYTGVPDRRDNEAWHYFWMKKLGAMGKCGIRTFSRALRYRHQTVVLPDGKKTTVVVGQEKGIDVRIALDVVRAALDNTYDVALIFSQDQDLSEVADEVKKISQLQRRWIKVACAFPVSPTVDNPRGINRTDWISIERTLYDQCLDRNDYRMKK